MHRSASFTAGDSQIPCEDSCVPLARGLVARRGPGSSPGEVVELRGSEGVLHFRLPATQDPAAGTPLRTALAVSVLSTFTEKAHISPTDAGDFRAVNEKDLELQELQAAPL